MVETETLDVAALLNSLKLQSQDWMLLELLPETDIKVLAKANVHISVHREDKHFSSYKITKENQIFLLHGEDLSSPIQLEECARDQRAIHISQELKKLKKIFLQILNTKVL